MSQEIRHIQVKDLILWSENPREQISSGASNQDIVDRALEDKHKKWKLQELAVSMGDSYDLSELPTVVYKDDKPIVYDGNRRVILALLHLKLVDSHEYSVETPQVPAILPCNVCDEETALNNVYRKHALRGSWNVIERDAFVHYNMGKEKSFFLTLDEALDGYISRNGVLNRVFVKEEVLNDRTLTSIGIKINAGKLQSQHSKEELLLILSDILSCVRDKKISTRNSRRNLLDVLSPNVRDMIVTNQGNDYQIIEVKSPPVNKDAIEHNATDAGSKPRTRRVKGAELQYFGGSLSLKTGEVNNMYRDMESLVQYYCKHKHKLSDGFPALLRMGFRLICETAANDEKETKKDPVGTYVNKYFDDAKKMLSYDEKTFLSSQNVKKESITQLLHTGAHNYSSSKAPEQGKAISIILGKMLLLSHGK